MLMGSWEKLENSKIVAFGKEPTKLVVQLIMKPMSKQDGAIAAVMGVRVDDPTIELEPLAEGSQRVQSWTSTRGWRYVLALERV